MVGKISMKNSKKVQDIVEAMSNSKYKKRLKQELLEHLEDAGKDELGSKKTLIESIEMYIPLPLLEARWYLLVTAAMGMIVSVFLAMVAGMILYNWQSALIFIALAIVWTSLYGSMLGQIERYERLTKSRNWLMRTLTDGIFFAPLVISFLFVVIRSISNIVASGDRVSALLSIALSGAKLIGAFWISKRGLHMPNLQLPHFITNTAGIVSGFCFLYIVSTSIVFIMNPELAYELGPFGSLPIHLQGWQAVVETIKAIFWLVKLPVSFILMPVGFALTGDPLNAPITLLYLGTMALFVVPILIYIYVRILRNRHVFTLPYISFSLLLIIITLGIIPPSDYPVIQWSAEATEITYRIEYRQLGPFTNLKRSIFDDTVPEFSYTIHDYNGDYIIEQSSGQYFKENFRSNWIPVTIDENELKQLYGAPDNFYCDNAPIQFTEDEYGITFDVQKEQTRGSFRDRFSCMELRYNHIPLFTETERERTILGIVMGENNQSAFIHISTGVYDPELIYEVRLD